jgi:hypothetical protein
MIYLLLIIIASILPVVKTPSWKNKEPADKIRQALGQTTSFSIRLPSKEWYQTVRGGCISKQTFRKKLGFSNF